jgi:chloramphenicol-sensitive protein RarD
VNGTDQQRGIRAGVLAYLIWGLLTIYWKRLADFDPVELIGWRIVTATIVMAVVITARRSWPVVRGALADRSSLRWIVGASVLLTGNWGAYVYAVVHGRVLETALGYFMAPLGTMAVGILVLGEHPTRAQKASMVLAAAAIVELTVSYGRVPVAALVIAVSWTFYGLCKRHIPLGGVDSFAAESFVLVVPAIVAVAALASRGDSIPRSGSAGELTLMAFSGVATAVPLSLFAFAAMRVPFTILGPIQYLVPIINLVLGWLVYDEQMPASRLVGFGLVWIALVLVTVDRIRVNSAARLATS